MLPIDQAVSLGPIRGIANIDRVLPVLLEGEPDAIIAHRGVIRRIPEKLPERTSLIMHLSAGTMLSGQGHIKTLTGTVTDAARLGADAVSVQVTFGTPDESAMLADLARIAVECGEWGMPLLAMVYLHGVDVRREPGKVAHGARVAAELGADIVKVPYTGSPESFAQVVEGCFIPVVVAGGEQTGGFEELRATVKGALTAGAAGACVGRAIFQHEDPRRALAEVRAAVHDVAYSALISED